MGKVFIFGMLLLIMSCGKPDEAQAPPEYIPPPGVVPKDGEDATIVYNVENNNYYCTPKNKHNRKHK